MTLEKEPIQLAQAKAPKKTRPPERINTRKENAQKMVHSDSRAKLKMADPKPGKKLLKEYKNEKNLPHDITKERIEKAGAVIQKALKELQNPPYRAALSEKKIQLKDTNYYLAIAIKESRGNPNAASKSKAVGYFQLRPGAVEQVNKIFETKFSHKEVKENSLLNALVGVLYWHICKDISQKTYNINMNGDNNDIAAFMYNAGPRATCDLAILLNHPKNYQDFEKGLVRLLAKRFPQKIKATSKEKHNKSYAVSYHSEFEVIQGMGDESISVEVNIAKIKKGKKVIERETHTYTAKKIIAALDYARIIQSIRNSKKYSA